MRVAIVLLVFGFLACSVSSAADHDHDVNWSQIVEKMNEIRKAITRMVESMVAEGIRGNAAVGAELQNVLDSTRPEIASNLDKLTKEVGDKSLTTSSARAYINNLRSMLHKVEALITPILTKLPQLTVENIRHEFRKSLTEITSLSRSFIVLLRNEARHHLHH